MLLLLLYFILLLFKNKVLYSWLDIYYNIFDIFIFWLDMNILQSHNYM